MRPGLLEIGIVIVVVLIIYGVTRMRRLGQDDAKKGKREGDEKAGRVAHPRLKIAGVVLTIIGIIALISTVSLVKWIFWGSLWALVIIAIGLLIMFMTRRR